MISTSGHRWVTGGPLLGLLSLLLMIGCNDPLEMRSEITKFRILGVKGTPAELEPGDEARVTALFAVPHGEKAQVVWLVPDLLQMVTTGKLTFTVTRSEVGSDGTATLKSDALVIPAALLAAADQFSGVISDQELSIPVYLLGCANGTVDESALVSGVENMTDISQLAALEKGCQGNDASGIAAFKSVPIKLSANAGCPVDAINTNPTIDKITANDELLSETGVTEVPCDGSDGCREPVEIVVSLTDDSFEYYCTADPLSPDKYNTRNELERAFVGFFADDGEFDSPRIRSEAATQAQSLSSEQFLDETGALVIDEAWLKKTPHGFSVKWLPPRKGGLVTMWFVAYDVRGGVDWRQVAVEAVWSGDV